MISDIITDVIGLVKSGITGEPAVLHDDLDFNNIYRLAVKHNSVPLLYYGLVNSGVTLPPELEEKFFAAVCRNIMMCEYQDAESAKLEDAFRNSGIDYMPLKGFIMRELYPKREMRIMADVDILIRLEQYEQIVPIMEDLGFKFTVESPKELIWDKPPLSVELHKSLVSDKCDDYYKYYADGWKFADKALDGSTKYVMSDEDFFIFMVTHLAKHYRVAGIGIRHITDIWVYLKNKPSLDMEYIDAEISQLKLTEFFKNILKTVDVWFNGAEHDNVTELITEKIINSGSFGTTDDANKSSALQELKSGKAKNVRTEHILQSVFLPYKNMCLLFPVLKKAPILLPALWAWRIIKTAVKKGTLAGHYNAVKALSPENISQYEQELKAVGLEYKFEDR